MSEKLLPKWIFFLAILPILLVAFVILNFTPQIPTSDEWDLIFLIEDYKSENLTFSSFWKQHVSQRVVFPRLFLVSTILLTHWNHTLITGIILLIATATFSLIAFQILKLKDCDKNIYYLLPVLSFLFFSLNQVRNFLWGWQVSIWSSYFFVVLSIFLLLNSKRNLLLPITTGIIASFSFMNGLLIWPIGLLILLKDKKKLFLWSLAGILSFFFYFYQFEIYPNDKLVFLTSDYILFFFSTLGAPLTVFFKYSFSFSLSKYTPALSVIIGLFGFLLFSLLLFKNKDKLKDIRPVIFLSLFSLGSVFLISLGRTAKGIFQSIASRYMTSSNLFWICLILLIFISKPSILKKTSKIVLLMLITSLFLLSSIFGYLLAAKNSQIYNIEKERIVQILSQPTDQNKELIQSFLAPLQKHKLSLFREK